MSLGYNNKTHVLDILKVEDLPFPTPLGQDTPKFGSLV